MRMLNLTFFALLFIASSIVSAQQTDESEDNFKIPGTALPLDELADTQLEPLKPPQLDQNDFGSNDSSDEVEKNDVVKIQDFVPVTTADTIESMDVIPVEVSNIEWVHIPFKEEKFKGLSIEIPRNWTRNGKRNEWQIKNGDSLEVHFQIGLDLFDEKELAEGKKRVKDFSVEKRTINGIKLHFILGKMVFRKVEYSVRSAIFDKPIFEYKQKLILGLTSSNIDRDDPIFNYILQSIKYDSSNNKGKEEEVKKKEPVEEVSVEQIPSPTEPDTTVQSDSVAPDIVELDTASQFDADFPTSVEVTPDTPVKTKPKRNTIPQLSGKTIQEAKTILKENGFRSMFIRGDTAPSLALSKKVQSQKPPAGLAKKRGSLVIIKVYAPVKMPPAKILFDGSLGKQWNELAAYGGDFKKFAKIKNKILIVKVPDGNEWGDTGIRSAKPLIKVPSAEEPFANKIVFDIDHDKSSNFIIALIPPNWNGNEEWRSHDIRLWVHKEDDNHSLLDLKIRRVQVMKTKVETRSISLLNVILRPDKLILVTDKDDNILLQSRLTEISRYGGIPKNGYRVSVLAKSPKENVASQLALRKIAKSRPPFDLTEPENDPTTWLDKMQKVVLFDGRILDKNWTKYQADGGDFIEHAQLKNGALIIDAPEKSGLGKSGIFSLEPLVWLDKFGKGAKSRITFKFDPRQTTGFVIALTPMYGLNGNVPGDPRALLYWRITDSGSKAKASLFLTPNKKWKPLWEQELTNKMPKEVSFILTPKAIQIIAPGLSKDSIPWELSAPSQSFRIYAYSQAEKNNQPVKMALKQIFLERIAGKPTPISKPPEGVKPLPVTVLFDGKPNEWWEGGGIAGAEFSKFGHFENGQMLVDVPKKVAGGKAKAGLKSKEPILVFNERILKTSHKLKIKIDPSKTTGFQMDMWNYYMHAVISFIRCTKDPCAGKYKLTLRRDPTSPYGVWARTVGADWVENNWDGWLTLETGIGWMAVHLSGGPSVRGNNFGTGKNTKLNVSIYSRNEESYGAAKFALEKVTSEWVMPNGMSKMDRFIYVDDNDFNADAFLDDLSAGMKRHINKFEKEWMGE